ncbi:MAG: DUF2933 domain-containing protein [Rhodospirillales bacterium]|nr:DUF2933 domain-containing protein [Rhodospirillales bacterium]
MNSYRETRAASGHAHAHVHARVPRWRSPSALVISGFPLIAAALLLTGHKAHLLGVLPILLIAACPLMHFVMHQGHAGHGGANAKGKES